MVAYIMCLIRVLYDTSTYTQTHTCKRCGEGGAVVTKCGHVQPVSQLAFWTQLHLAGSRFFILFMCCRSLSSAGPSSHYLIYPPLSLSLLAWRAAFCLYFSVCQLLATKLNTCLCFLWPTHWLKLAKRGGVKTGVVSVGVDVCSRMYVQLGHKPSAISA